MSAADSQMLESRAWAVIDIARLFGIPGILIGIEDKTSAWGTGVEVITANFLRATVGPILDRFGAELTRKLAPRNYDMFITLDRTDLLKPSAKDRAMANTTALGSGSGSGWMSVNEVREREGLEALDDPKYDEVKVGGGGSVGGMLDEALEPKPGTEDDEPPIPPTPAE